MNNPKQLMTKAGLYEETLDGRRGNKITDKQLGCVEK